MSAMRRLFGRLSVRKARLVADQAVVGAQAEMSDSSDTQIEPANADPAVVLWDEVMPPEAPSLEPPDIQSPPDKLLH